MWVRGLKLRQRVNNLKFVNVAPHVGAWIETDEEKEFRSRLAVAPHVGAWIETRAICKLALLADVAPHVGAWIETLL